MNTIGIVLPISKLTPAYLKVLNENSMKPAGPMKSKLRLTVPETVEITNDTGHLKGTNVPKFSTLSEAVLPEAEKSLSPEVRREILIMVAGAVRQLIQEAEEKQ